MSRDRNVSSLDQDHIPQTMRATTRNEQDENAVYLLGADIVEWLQIKFSYAKDVNIVRWRRVQCTYWLHTKRGKKLQNKRGGKEEKKSIC